MTFHNESYGAKVCVVSTSLSQNTFKIISCKLKINTLFWHKFIKK